MTHKDFRIKFKVRGRRYEAVGFLNDGESSVNGYTVLSRTAVENNGAIGEKDAKFLQERQSKFPKKLRKYRLATNHAPYDVRLVSYFCWSDVYKKWSHYWFGLDLPWYDFVLVLRRCP